MADAAPPIWWIEVIKIAPGLIGTLSVVTLVALNYRVLQRMISRTTKFKGLGIEAEFAVKDLEKAIIESGTAVSDSERDRAVKRLDLLNPLLQNERILWVDDVPANNRNERSLIERVGARITTVRTSAEAELELTDHKYLMVITDLEREGKGDEGLQFVKRTIAKNIKVPTIAYVGTSQAGLTRPADIFGITNRPDELIHLVCDVVARERL